jgi:SpoVK/Ycf46/Vps4 family AAA+-type ATPase
MLGTACLQYRLRWPYVEITPPEFVGKGMEQIHARTTEIFGDLADMVGVVVLFDEMDALAAKRDGSAQLDAVRQLLTTGMLPKLADLFRRKQIVHFRNTNHRKGIDPAIMRAGRFDMLLHFVPPTRLSEITPEAIEDYIERRLSSGRRIHTKFALQHRGKLKPATAHQ